MKRFPNFKTSVPRTIIQYWALFDPDDQSSLSFLAYSLRQIDARSPIDDRLDVSEYSYKAWSHGAKT
ncbi:hypothetical protein EYB25_007604 [Talaromyces marneffei]|nr:hypothetical protein EYB25_007604 [Talaromyces marneffei]